MEWKNGIMIRQKDNKMDVIEEGAMASGGGKSQQLPPDGGGT